MGIIKYIKRHKATSLAIGGGLAIIGLGAWNIKLRDKTLRLEGELENTRQLVRGYEKEIRALSHNNGKLMTQLFDRR